MLFVFLASLLLFCQIPEEKQKRRGQGQGSGTICSEPVELLSMTLYNNKTLYTLKVNLQPEYLIKKYISIDISPAGFYSQDRIAFILKFTVIL